MIDSFLHFLLVSCLVNLRKEIIDANFQISHSIKQILQPFNSKINILNIKVISNLK